MGSNAPVHRYGWLEQDEGMWHFLTNLYADPGESTRRWSDSLSALEELKQEGWTVMSRYPEGRAGGYGLIWNSPMDVLQLAVDSLDFANRKSPALS